MTVTLPAEVLQDDIAVSLARATAVANKRAGELGIDVLQSIISITQRSVNDDTIWRINYGPKDYVGRRGGDLIIEVNQKTAGIHQVLRGQ